MRVIREARKKVGGGEERIRARVQRQADDEMTCALHAAVDNALARVGTLSRISPEDSGESPSHPGFPKIFLCRFEKETAWHACCSSAERAFSSGIVR